MQISLPFGYATPSLTEDGAYLVYTLNQDWSQSHLNPPGICVLRLRDGSKYIFENVRCSVSDVTISVGEFAQGDARFLPKNHVMHIMKEEKK